MKLYNLIQKLKNAIKNVKQLKELFWIVISKDKKI